MRNGVHKSSGSDQRLGGGAIRVPSDYTFGVTLEEMVRPCSNSSLVPTIICPRVLSKIFQNNRAEKYRGRGGLGGAILAEGPLTAKDCIFEGECNILPPLPEFCLSCFRQHGRCGR